MLFITDFLNLAAEEEEEEEREETCGHKSNRKWPNFASEERGTFLHKYRRRTQTMRAPSESDAQ